MHCIPVGNAILNQPASLKLGCLLMIVR